MEPRSKGSVLSDQLASRYIDLIGAKVQKKGNCHAVALKKEID